MHAKHGGGRYCLAWQSRGSVCSASRLEGFSCSVRGLGDKSAGGDVSSSVCSDWFFIEVSYLGLGLGFRYNGFGRSSCVKKGKSRLALGVL